MARLNKTLTTLSFSTCLGGNGRDQGGGLAVDGAGNAYVAGMTRSPDDDPSTTEVETPFPTKSSGAPGAFFDPTCGTDGRCNRDDQLRVKDDAFVTKISPG